MKRLLTVFVTMLVVVVCASAFAAGHEYTKKTPQQRAEHMTKLLDLTPEQQAKVEDIITRRDAEMEPLFTSLKEATDKEEQREIKMDILEQHKRFREELNSVLTEAQQKTYQEFIDTRIRERKMGTKTY